MGNLPVRSQSNGVAPEATQCHKRIGLEAFPVLAGKIAVFKAKVKSRFDAQMVNMFYRNTENPCSPIISAGEYSRCTFSEKKSSCTLSKITGRLPEDYHLAISGLEGGWTD
jgi:hypothetical protein